MKTQISQKKKTAVWKYKRTSRSLSITQLAFYLNFTILKYIVVFISNPIEAVKGT